MSIPVDMLVDPLYRRSHVGTLMLLTDDQRAVVSSAPVSAETGRMLKMNAAQMDNDTYRYTLQGAILREPRLSGIALTARFLGLRLLRTAYVQATRALENVAINHVHVSVTPIGLCIVRQSDYSILTGNALAASGCSASHL